MGRNRKKKKHIPKGMREPNKFSDTYITGRVDHVNPRFAYIVSEETENDLKISTKNLNGALNGDTVRVAVYAKKKDRFGGEVLEILERKREDFVGKIEISPGFAFVIPDGKKMHCDIFVKHEDINHASNGDKVIVKIKEWPDKSVKQGRSKQPSLVGIVTQVLGKAGEHNAEMQSIMAEFGIPFSFPENVIKESKVISSQISQKEIKRRRDFRDITTFTIDPEDAKDFDDAISISKLENGNWKIGIHIADVTHYVQHDTLLDKEAFKRGTSVYLVDRVIPMLPEKLSNDLCSLKPLEDKLTLSAVFELDEQANIKNGWFGKTIIHSNRRFTYDEVQQTIDSKQGDFAKEINVLNDLAKKLQEKRFKNGAIAFETLEVKFKLNQDGVPISVHPKERKEAHKLVEDFMLLANKKVAEFVFNLTKGKDKKHFVYRLHDSPDKEKLRLFAIFAGKFGYNIDLKTNGISKSLNQLIDQVEGKSEQNVLQNIAIRTMAKAKYGTDTDGHFGLAFAHYTHFTSPIRRYPDMVVHRLLYHYLKNGNSVDKNALQEKCNHASKMEIVASDAERASIKYKQVEYMSNYIGEQFEGIVSGVSEWGVFVEIVKTKCEGLVRMSDMSDDYYYLDAENYRIIGERTKKMITLGDLVKVKVKSTDLDRRTIDLVFAD
ncbi:MAG: ribonuclease R [Cytophagales bacterium]|nr:ribonuclease R [Cytophagales bacterium]